MIEIIKADGQAEQARIAAMRARAAQVGADIQRAVSAVMAESTWSSDTGMTSQKMEYQEI